MRQTDVVRNKQEACEADMWCMKIGSPPLAKCVESRRESVIWDSLGQTGKPWAKVGPHLPMRSASLGTSPRNGAHETGYGRRLPFQPM